MSRAKTSLAALAIALSACASAPDPQEQAAADLAQAMEDATKPAPQEEIDAANRADPLTKANFWAKEHAKDPENLDVALTFAAALRGIGSNERAIEVMSQVLVVHPGDPDLLMALGRALSAAGNTLAAARAFEQATHTAPERPETWAALGITFDKMEQHLDAQNAYEKALAIQPGRTSTLANYGLSLALIGDLSGAEAKLRAAAANPDADLRVTENLALILGLQGKYDEMAALSAQHAPNAVAEQNAKMIQDMIQPVRSWEALAEPDTPAPALPASAEKAKASTSTPVGDEPMGLISQPEAAAPAPSTGLRLRRTPG